MHLGHDNIRRLSNRPFNSIAEMDMTLIANWNSRVTNKDDVYILGDFSFKSQKALEYISMLNGRKHLIKGNHDKKLVKNPEFCKYFVEIVDITTVNDGGTEIVLFHYPMIEWDGYYRGTLLFYGHVHNTIHNETTREAFAKKNAYNVGVDVIGYYPRTKDEIINHKY